MSDKVELAKEILEINAEVLDNFVFFSGKEITLKMAKLDYAAVELAKIIVEESGVLDIPEFLKNKHPSLPLDTSRNYIEEIKEQARQEQREKDADKVQKTMIEVSSITGNDTHRMLIALANLDKEIRNGG